jgi:hypothetical protein
MMILPKVVYNMHMDYSQIMPIHALRKTLQVGWKSHILGYKRLSFYLLKQESLNFDIFICCVW